MSNQLILDHVDIYKLPSVDKKHQNTTGCQFSIGDLHGNPIKLIFMLIKHGIATNLTEEDYENLVRIYKIPTTELTKKDLSHFNTILAKIKFNPKGTIRLIGDELADRGNNDYFTLKVLEKLNQHGVSVEILLSNHGCDFIEASELQNDFHPPRLDPVHHACSMEKLQQLISRGIVTREEVLAIAQKDYKPKLRAISYSLNKDKSEITIYSHAGIGLASIRKLAEKLNVIYEDDTATKLAQTIDNINIQFQTYVQNNTVHSLYTDKMMMYGYQNSSKLTQDSPFEFLMWNRRYENLNRPEYHSGYRLNFVHGHDSKDLTQGHIYNLDNHLGKSEERNEDEYNVLYCQNLTPQSYQNTQAKKLFLKKLEQIHLKAQELKEKHPIAADKAEKLYKTVKSCSEQFFAGAMSNQQFKKISLKAIEKARPELEKHRGWNQLLGNLALAIVGLGIFYIIAGLINKSVTGHFLFFKTDSAKKLDELEKGIHTVLKT